jgi:hypothetical protein
MEWEEWQQAYGRLDKAEGLSGLHKRDSITSVVRVARAELSLHIFEY